MNEYQTLIVLLYEFKKQYELGEISKDEYNNHLDDIFDLLRKLDIKNANSIFNDFLKLNDAK